MTALWNYIFCSPQVVPPEKFLFFKHQQGWDPLCKFLGLSVPDTPYPHRNKGGAIADEIVETSYIFEPIRRDFKISFAIITISVLLIVAMSVLLGIFT